MLFVLYSYTLYQDLKSVLLKKFTYNFNKFKYNNEVYTEWVRQWKAALHIITFSHGADERACAKKKENFIQKIESIFLQMMKARIAKPNETVTA